MEKKFPVEVPYSAPDVKVISFHSHGFLCAGSNESEIGIDVGGGVEMPGEEKEG